VLTEDYRRGTLEARLATTCWRRRIRPHLRAVSGYGRDGPLADKGGFDLIAQGFAG
jgi:formyl-CoA transferase